jgi:GT2 family glycosyltransferase
MPHNGAAQDAQISALRSLVERLRRRIDFVEQSRFWKLRALWFTLKARFGLRHDLEPPLPAHEYVESMDAAASYTRWLIGHEPRAADLRRLRQIAQTLERRPSICIIVDDASGTAANAIDAVKAQVYPWACLLCTSEVSQDKDAAVRFNAALEACRDEFVAFCDPDEFLAPDACFEVALAHCELPDADVIYGDRDMVAPNGQRTKPLFLPDWSPETFLSQMYTGRLMFYRREAVVSAGGFRLGFGTALHYDLALRVTERSKSIDHRSLMLYHEQEDGREATDQRDAAKAISSALERRGEQGRVEHPYAGVDSNIVRYSITKPGRVEVIVPTRDLPDFLERCLVSVFTRTTYRDFRVTIIDNGSVMPETSRLLAAWEEREPQRFRVVRVDEPFNFSRLVNVGARSTDGPYLLLLNNDTEVLADDWLGAMLEQAQREPIGAVGARLLYGDETVQHAGVVVGLGSLAGHVYRFTPADDPGPGGAVATVRNYSALTGACLMVRREVFEAVHGFDEALSVEFNDVDFCLRLLRAGYRNVYLPHVVLRHHESTSRGVPRRSAGRTRNTNDRTLFQKRWGTGDYRDPYYNPNLTVATEAGSFPRDSSW